MINIFNVRTNHPSFLYQYVAAPSMGEAVKIVTRKFHDGHASRNGGAGYLGGMNVTKAEFYCKAVGADYDTANTEACADLYTVSFESSTSIGEPIHKSARVLAHDIVSAMCYVEGVHNNLTGINIPRAELDCWVLGAKVTEDRNAR